MNICLDLNTHVFVTFLTPLIGMRKRVVGEKESGDKEKRRGGRENGKGDRKKGGRRSE